NAGGKKLPAEETSHQYSSFLSLQSSMMSQKKNTVALRISSAGLHRIKELKNEIFYLQHKVEASSLENHILKQLQCRHSKAIGRYESSESSLTGLLAGHYNEVRTLRKLLRMSQEDEKKTSRKLRKVEAELLKAKDALQTLHVLSEDKALAEREELDHRLSVLTEKIEVNDKRIQSLEKQVKLNNSTFSRQLANENKKAVEAGIITKNLQMEINALHQKIKEKDRQLYVKYIYANWMPKIPKDKKGSVPHEKSLSINRSVQVDKESFRSLLLSQYQTQETEKSPIPLIKEKKSSEGKNQKVEAREAYADGQCRTEMPSTNKLPKTETSNRTHREYLMESRLLMEEYTCLEFMKEEENGADLLKQELKKRMKTEENPPSDSVKENNQEEENNPEKDAVEEYEQEEKKAREQLNKSEEAGSKRVEAGSKRVTPGPSNRTTSGVQKTSMFSEALENLHHGLPTSGTTPPTGSLCNRRRAGQDSNETAESKVKNSFGLYEPSFGKVTKARQKDSSTEAEDCAHMTCAERKKSYERTLW
ncbi:LCA5L protein, partial [Trogon melanurus]|nr:LCA5L protein [Trogon melanurus]